MRTPNRRHHLAAQRVVVLAHSVFIALNRTSPKIQASDRVGWVKCLLHSSIVEIRRRFGLLRMEDPHTQLASKAVHSNEVVFSIDTLAKAVETLEPNFDSSRLKWVHDMFQLAVTELREGLDQGEFDDDDEFENGGIVELLM